jgi:dienelactone hydrolase
VDGSGLNPEGENYEQWRATHDDLRVNIDIRAAAACLRERYGVNSVVVWGTCFGGGRALEAASGVFPNDNVHDIDGNIGPLPVDPMACIAWYPTRYDLKETFGKAHRGRNVAADGTDRKVAVMAIFAGNDKLEGATPEDAAALKESLGEDSRVNDFMVKVFPGQEHGFAHNGLGFEPEERYKEDYEEFVDDEFGGAGRVSFESGEAEVACLLSTAWMETYSRVFLPTVGPTVSKDENEEQWQSLDMKGLDEANSRDIREEIETALNDFSFSPEGAEGKKFDRFDEESHEELKKILMGYQEGEDAGDNQILPEDDLNDAYEKLRRWDSNIQLF